MLSKRIEELLGDGTTRTHQQIADILNAEGLQLKNGNKVSAKYVGQVAFNLRHKNGGQPRRPKENPWLEISFRLSRIEVALGIVKLAPGECLVPPASMLPEPVLVKVPVNVPASVLDENGTTVTELPGKRKERAARKPSPKAEALTELEVQAQRMPGTFVWMDYKGAFLNRYRVEPPVRSAKTNSQIQQLIKEVGAETARKLVVYYLRREDAFYVNAKHPIGLLLTNAHKLVTEMQTRETVTMTDARRNEKASVTRESIETYLAEQGDANE